MGMNHAFRRNKNMWAKASWLAACSLVAGAGCTHWREYVHNGYKVARLQTKTSP